MAGADGRVFSRENSVHYLLWSVLVSESAIQFSECPRHFPTINGSSSRWEYLDECEKGVCCVFATLLCSL